MTMDDSATRIATAFEFPMSTCGWFKYQRNADILASYFRGVSLGELAITHGLTRTRIAQIRDKGLVLLKQKARQQIVQELRLDQELPP